MTLLAADHQVETDRLILRRITRDDLPFYARIHADPEVARYLAHGRPRTIEESTTWMNSVLAGYIDVGMGQLAITRKQDGTMLGRCGVSHLEVEIEPRTDGTRTGHYYPARAPIGTAHTVEAELGYTLDKSAWGKGYAREAVRAMHAYLTAKRPDLRIVSLIHPENTRSIRLASDFGVTLVDRITYADRPYDRYAWPAGKSPSIDR